MKKIFTLVIGALLCVGSIYSQNVGIGTNSPNAKLDIAGDLALREGSPVSAPAAGGNFAITLNAAGPDNSFYRITGAPTASFLLTGISNAQEGQQITLINATTSGKKFEIKNSNVAASDIITGTGENLEIPSKGSITLHYSSAVSRWYVTSSVNELGNNEWHNIGNSRTSPSTVPVGTAIPSSENFIGTGDNKDFVLGTNQYERMRITNAGNVGLNNNAPGELLDVKNGNIVLSNSNNTSGSVKFQEPSASGNNFTALKAQAQSANVTYTLPAADGSNGYVLSTNGSGALSWQPSAAAAAYVLSSGKKNAPDFSYSSSSAFTNNTSGAIPDNTGSSLTRTFTVSGITQPGAKITVTGLNINHLRDGDLLITLTSPSGIIVKLSDHNGGTGQRYTNTAFDDVNGTMSITAGTAPFTNTYFPQEVLSSFAGESNGTWTLTITDDVTGTAGSFTSATLNVYYETANMYQFVGEVLIPVSAGDNVAVDGYYSAKMQGTGVIVKITRSTSSGAAAPGTVVGYSASNAGSGNKYYNASVKAVDTGLPAATYYYKLWAGGTSAGNYNYAGTDNYQLSVSKIQ